MATATIENKRYGGNPYVAGSDWIQFVKWVGDSSYLSGGETLSLKECGFGPEAVYLYANVLAVQNLSEQATYIPNTAFYDGEKLHLYDAATGKELASTKDASKVTVWLEVHCSSN